jgi:PAS domain-containing protein
MFIGFALHKIVVDNKDQPIDYIFLEINDSFERLTGLKRDNIAGKKVTEIIPHISQEKPDLIKIFGDVALKGDVAKFELQFKPFNKWYSVSAYSPMKGYFVSSGRMRKNIAVYLRGLMMPYLLLILKQAVF